MTEAAATASASWTEALAGGLVAVARQKGIRASRAQEGVVPTLALEEMRAGDETTAVVCLYEINEAGACRAMLSHHQPA